MYSKNETYRLISVNAFCIFATNFYYYKLLERVKDTVLVSLGVPGWSGHVEQHQSGLVGLVDDDLVELHGRVHPPDVGVVTGEANGAVDELDSGTVEQLPSQLTVSC